jgi:signal peptide peptidase SppA
MRFQHVIEQVYFHPWYITPAGHAAIHAVLESHLGVMAPFSERAEQRRPLAGLDLADFINPRRKMSIDREGIATIHVLGPLGKGLSNFEKSCGATDFADIQQEYKDAIDSGARGILLDINSPGGTVAGTPETADLIGSKKVPTVAHADELMASAAYYIGAGADAIVASRSAMIGSIGVYIPWVDYSARIKAMGLRPDPIVNSGGDLKALGFGGTLTDAQRAHLQESVDADFAAFQDHVRTFRSVPNDAMRGQVLKGKATVDSNLVDQIGDMSAAREKLLSLIKR